MASALYKTVTAGDYFFYETQNEVKQNFTSLQKLLENLIPLQKEISDITYEVSKRIVATNDSLAKEGKEGMESTRRVLDAQTRFFQNVEEKARLLGPEREQTPNVQIN